MPASAPSASRTIDPSATLRPLIDDGGSERCGQHWHLAAEIGTACQGFGLLVAGRYESRNRPATISDRHLVTLAHLFDQCGEVLSSFTNTCFLHGHIVLHVAQTCKREIDRCRISCLP